MTEMIKAGDIRIRVSATGVCGSDIHMWKTGSIIAQLMGDLAKTAGASLVAMSKTNDRKLAKAREMGKFDCYLDGKDPNRRAVYEEVSKGGFDVVFEAVCVCVCVGGGGANRRLPPPWT